MVTKLTLVEVIIDEEITTHGVDTLSMLEYKRTVFGWAKDLGCSWLRAHEIMVKFVKDKY